MLDELLWKGDFLVCRAATGAVIRQVLTQSDEYDGSESDRALARLGTFRDSFSGDWIVDGSALQDEKLYSVATTDYVSLGDTGYPAFREMPVPPATRVRDYGKLEEISALVCRNLMPGVPREWSRTRILSGDDRHDGLLRSDPAQA